MVLFSQVKWWYVGFVLVESTVRNCTYALKKALDVHSDSCSVRICRYTILKFETIKLESLCVTEHMQRKWQQNNALGHCTTSMYVYAKIYR